VPVRHVVSHGYASAKRGLGVGLTRHGVRFLLHCRSSGVDFEDCAMIGRQSLHLSMAQLRASFAKSGSILSAAEADGVFTEESHYAEPLFKRLGAQRIESFDASHYENATHVVDFNLPLPAPFSNRYSAVIDGGSLEHVFNYPQALKNAMEMVRVGGHLMLITPTHSLSGHGFYQLSAELFFRALSPVNGYEVPQVLVCSTTKDAWYSVADPATVAGRVLLGGRLTDHLFVVSRRVATAAIFANWPQQSDYSATWQDNGDAPNPSTPPALKARLRANRHRIPSSLLWLYHRLTARAPQGLTRVRL
jgi:hypothetical protein